jgi:MYXO-CTERM domain-containing protein
VVACYTRRERATGPLRTEPRPGVISTVTDRRRSLVLLVFWATTATPAQAYVRLQTAKGAPYHWTQPDPHLEVYLGEPRGPLGSPELLQAVTAAAAAWSHQELTCSAVSLQVDGVAEPTAPIARDGVNRLIFRRDRWCPDSPALRCHGHEILALTTDVTGLHSGEILEADIEVNAVDFTWADLVAHPEAIGAYDLQNALTHELGHFIGFAHTCRVSVKDPTWPDDRGKGVQLCGQEDEVARESTMAATVTEHDVERRTLSPDDQRGVCDVYPAGIPQGVTIIEGGGGGCAVEGPGRGGWWWLALLAALARWRRAR